MHYVVFFGQLDGRVLEQFVLFDLLDHLGLLVHRLLLSVSLGVLGQLRDRLSHLLREFPDRAKYDGKRQDSHDEQERVRVAELRALILLQGRHSPVILWILIAKHDLVLVARAEEIVFLDS